MPQKVVKGYDDSKPPCEGEKGLSDQNMAQLDQGSELSGGQGCVSNTKLDDVSDIVACQLMSDAYKCSENFNGRTIEQSQFDKHFMSNLAKFIFKAKMNTTCEAQTQTIDPVVIVPSADDPTNLNDSVSTKSVEIQGLKMPRYVKICTLYKPILRRFKSYLRERFDQGRKMSLYQHWTEYMYLKNVRTFMDDIKLPQSLKDQESTLKMLTILFPCTIRKIRPSDYA